MSEYHRGKKLRQLVDRLKKRADWSMYTLAEDGLDVSREYMYKKFRDETLDWDLIVKALNFMKYSGIEEFPDMPPKYRERVLVSEGTNPLLEQYNLLLIDRDEWKRRYMAAVERENDILKNGLPWFKEFEQFVKNVNQHMLKLKDAPVH